MAKSLDEDETSALTSALNSQFIAYSLF